MQVAVYRELLHDALVDEGGGEGDDVLLQKLLISNGFGSVQHVAVAVALVIHVSSAGENDSGVHRVRIAVVEIHRNVAAQHAVAQADLLLELIFAPNVIAVEERDPLGLRMLDAVVADIGNALVRLHADVDDTRILLRKILKNKVGAIGGAVVNDQKGQVPVGLVQDASDRLGDGRGYIINSHDYGNRIFCHGLESSLCGGLSPNSSIKINNKQ